MATTPHGIPLADGSTVVQPIQTPLNAMATALDTALDDVLVDVQASIASAAGIVRGTANQRVATTSTYWQLWQDTDGSQKLYVGNKAGGWRQFSGAATSPSRGWDTTFGGNAGRTDQITLPTVLLPNESLLVQVASVGSGFGFMGVANITKNTSNTVVAIRFMQLMSTAAQAYSFNWQIVQT